MFEPPALPLPLDNILESVPVGIALYDPSGGIIYANEIARQIWAIDSPAQYASRFQSGVRLYGPHGAELQAHDLPSRVSLRTGNDSPATRIVIEKGEGAKQTVLSTVRLHRSESGALVCASETLLDISAYELAHADALERSVHAQQEAEASVRRKDDLLAWVAHELRTPLSAMAGWLSLLETDKLDVAARRQAREVLRRNLEMQKRMIDDIFDLSHIAIGKVTLNYSEEPVNKLIASAVESVRFQAEAKGITVALEPLQEDRRIRCDPQRFNQILINLLTNAIKFTPRDGTVRAGAIAEDSACAIYVSDTGIGMDPASLPQMFQAYKQNGRSEAKGLGLGLSIARRLAEAHGAKIEATSAGPGKGSTFWVHLPACGGTAEPSDQIQQPEDLRNSLILVALNELELSTQLRSEFAAKGAEAVLASSSVEALRLIVQRRPDLIVCNLDLQGTHQFETIRNIRLLSIRDGGRTPAIALAPALDQQSKALIIAAGYDICLPVGAAPVGVLAEATQVLKNGM